MAEVAGHVDGVLCINGDEPRISYIPTSDIGALGGEFLNVTPRISYIHIALSVDRNILRLMELAGSFSVGTPSSDKGAIRAEFLDTCIALFRNIDIAIRIYSDSCGMD